MNLLLSRAEVAGRLVDVRVCEGRVAAVAAALAPLRDEEVVDARGAALLPGLHDHHVHLLATAAAMASVRCGPPEVTSVQALAHTLRTAAARTPADAWIRGVGYAESVAGDLDRHLLDRLVPGRPVRVQHRSGALWVLNTAALDITKLHQVMDPDVERDAAGQLTGRLWRFDERLRYLVQDPRSAPDLAPLSRRLASYGITGVTDATPDLGADTVALLGDAIASGQLLQHVVALGATDDRGLPMGVTAGPRKVMLHDHDLPTYPEIVAVVAAAHASGRPVAVHCVTREALLLTLLALEDVGPLPGDRIEHAAVVPPGAAQRMADLGVAVVTQPVFVADRGDDYLRDVDRDDVPYLYPYASLLAAGVRVAASSDAPYGDPDPWRTAVAARDRRTARGAVVSEGERVDVATALAGYLSPPTCPGGPSREVRPGAAADLCLLDAPLRDVVAEPSAERVRLVLLRGEPHAGVET